LVSIRQVEETKLQAKSLPVPKSPAQARIRLPAKSRLRANSQLLEKSQSLANLLQVQEPREEVQPQVAEQQAQPAAE
jgi:hypothetical protein